MSNIDLAEIDQRRKLILLRILSIATMIVEAFLILFFALQRIYPLMLLAIVLSFILFISLHMAKKR